MTIEHGTETELRQHLYRMLLSDCQEFGSTTWHTENALWPVVSSVVLDEDLILDA